MGQAKPKAKVYGGLEGSAGAITSQGVDHTHKPASAWSDADEAQTRSTGSSKGITHNQGKITIAGDGLPGAKTNSGTSDGLRAKSGVSDTNAASFGPVAIAALDDASEAKAVSISKGVPLIGGRGAGYAKANTAYMYDPTPIKKPTTKSTTAISGGRTKTHSLAQSFAGEGTIAIAVTDETAAVARAGKDHS